MFRVSDPVIAAIVEGKTDIIVIEAALNAILEKPFTLIQLQPDESDAFGGFGKTGGGWGGVYKWCRQIVSHGFSNIENNHVFHQFDIIIIHLDADVAEKRYSDIDIDDPPGDNLPCSCPCPPASHTVEALKKVMLTWLNQSQTGEKTVFCIPSKNTETWVTVALFAGSDPRILEDIECNKTIYNYLMSKPARNRLIRSVKGKAKKITVQYQNRKSDIENAWPLVIQHCFQAKVFYTIIHENLVF